MVDVAIQDTFVAVWKGATGFRPTGPDGDAAAWIWTIAIRRLLSTLRGSGHRWLTHPAAARAGRLDIWPVRYGEPEVNAAAALLARPRPAVTAALETGWSKLTAPGAGPGALAGAGLGPAQLSNAVDPTLRACS